MVEKKVYHIRVTGMMVEVSKEVYLTYYRMNRSERAQREKDAYHKLVSYNAMDTDELLAESMIPDPNALSVEDIAISRDLCDQLHRCLTLLPQAERDLLHALYFEDLTERDLSEKAGVPRMTIHDRKVKALTHLKKLMEK